MTHIVVKSLALAAFSISLAACGGGNKNASTDKTAAPVAINSSNFETVLATSLQVSLDSAPGGVIENQPRPSPTAGGLGDGLNRGVYASQSYQDKKVDSATGIDFSTNKTKCPAGGDALANIAPGVGASQSDIFNLVQIHLSFDFNNCRTDSLWLDGNAELQFSALTGLLASNGTLNVNVDANLTDFHVAETTSPSPEKFQSLYNVTGKVKLKLSNPGRTNLEASLTSDGDLTYRLRQNGNEYLHLNNFSSVINASMQTAIYSWETSGELSYVGNRAIGTTSLPTSKVRISTPTPFSGYGFVVPNRGVLRVEDDNSIAELRVKDEVTLEYAIDANKDGKFENIYTKSWAEFLNAQPL